MYDYAKYPLRIILSFMCIHYNFTERQDISAVKANYILQNKVIVDSYSLMRYNAIGQSHSIA